jgi:hypothetical protein
MAARILNYNIFVDLTAHINQWLQFLCNYIILMISECVLYTTLYIYYLHDHLHSGDQHHCEDNPVPNLHSHCVQEFNMAARILNYNIFVDFTAHINQW